MIVELQVRCDSCQRRDTFSQTLPLAHVRKEMRARGWKRWFPAQSPVAFDICEACSLNERKKGTVGS